MQHVAELAGVSSATVSMCFRNHPDVSDATRKRVLEIARKLKYRPNPYLSVLMRSRRYGKTPLGSPVVALVCLGEKPEHFRNSVSATVRQMFHGALSRAEDQGYVGQEFWIRQDGMSAERFSRMLHARGIRGVLLSPLPDNTEPPELKWDWFSAVGLGVPFKDLTVPTVCNDHFFSSYRAVQECARLGYRRPGLVLRKSHHDRFHGRWESGFAAAQAATSPTELTRPLFVDDWNNLPEFSKWLIEQRPDAIIALGCEHVERYLVELGVQVPRDLGLVGLSRPELGDRYSGIYQNGELTGASAMGMLIGMMERNETGLPKQASTLMIEGLWNNGRTLRAQPAPLAAALKR
jgi:DNA-binding LacI/PurR family transcriptional regulator